MILVSTLYAGLSKYDEDNKWQSRSSLGYDLGGWDTEFLRGCGSAEPGTDGGLSKRPDHLTPNVRGQ